MEHIHVTRDGKQMKLSEMDDKHLMNTINFLKKKSVKGIVVGNGVNDAWGISFDEYEEIKGEDYLLYFNYYAYISEAKKRGLLNE